jgi:enoyl-CoA hydratase
MAVSTNELLRDGRVQISSADGVALLRLHRPDKMNAFDREQIDALRDALEWFRGADDVRVGVLTGSERAFSAGGDITTFDALDADSGLAFTRVGYDLLRPLETGEKPIIAAVEGYCLAGGLEVALACDFVICGEKAKFGFGEVDLGLIPGWGGTVRLPRAIPVRRARQMILTSERIGAEEALRLGLVNEVLPSGGALDRALELAAAIAAQPPAAVRAAKMVVEQAADAAPIDAALAAERAVCGALFGTEDVHTRVRAWTEKARARERA